MARIDKKHLVAHLVNRGTLMGCLDFIKMPSYEFVLMYVRVPIFGCVQLATVWPNPPL